MNKPRLVIGKQYTIKADRETYMRECRQRYEERNAAGRKKRKREWYLAHRDLCIARAAESKRRIKKTQSSPGRVPYVDIRRPKQSVIPRVAV